MNPRIRAYARTAELLEMNIKIEEARRPREDEPLIAELVRIRDAMRAASKVPPPSPAIAPVAPRTP